MNTAFLPSRAKLPDVPLPADNGSPSLGVSEAVVAHRMASNDLHQSIYIALDQVDGYERPNGKTAYHMRYSTATLREKLQ